MCPRVLWKCPDEARPQGDKLIRRWVWASEIILSFTVQRKKALHDLSSCLAVAAAALTLQDKNTWWPGDFTAYSDGSASCWRGRIWGSTSKHIVTALAAPWLLSLIHLRAVYCKLAVHRVGAVSSSPRFRRKWWQPLCFLGSKEVQEAVPRTPPVASQTPYAGLWL